MADPVSLGITVALTAANYALTASQTIEGPRLDDLTINTADYGADFNYFLGTRKFTNCPSFFGEDLREVRVKHKTKGGKYNEYRYYGTWTNHIAYHEIDGVTRIWADKHLVYDVTSVGPVSPGGIFVERLSSGKGKSSSQRRMNLSRHLRIYLGTEDQEPDERMLLTVEAEHGEGSCSAYRGMSYLMWEEVPLEKFGNRIFQVTTEAARAVAPAYPYETFDAIIGQPSRLWGFTFSPDFSRFMWGTGSYEIWDTAARSRMISGSFPEGIILQGVFGISNSGTIYALSHVGPGTYDHEVRAFSPDGTSLSGGIFDAPYQGGLRLVMDGRGIEHIITGGEAFISYFYHFTLNAVGGAVQISTGDIGDGSFWTVRGVCVDSYGDVWVSGSIAGFFDSWDDLFLYRVVDTGARPGTPGFFHINHGHFGNGAGTSFAHYNGHFIVHWDGNRLLKIDDETGAIVDDVAKAGDVYNHAKQWANLQYGAASIWLNASEISLDDLSTIRSIDLTDWKNEDADGIIYDPINEALICAPQFSQVITFRYLDRVSGDGVQRSSAIAYVAELCGLEAGDYDVSFVTGTVAGVSWVAGLGKAIVGPWLEAWDIDPRSHDFSIQFLPRGSASSGTIPLAHFAGPADNRYELTIVNDEDLPLQATMIFADVDREQADNTAFSPRAAGAVHSKEVLSIDMRTMAMEAAEARGLLDRYFRRQWFERYGLGNVLGGRYLGIETGDVKTLALEQESWTMRCVSWSFGAEGSISLRWKRDDPNMALTSGADGAAMDGRPESFIPIPGLTKGAVLDVPLAIDAHDSLTPFLYYGAAPYNETVFWAGADFQQADNDIAEDYDPAWAAVSAQDAVDWGYAAGALGDAVATVVDYGNTLTVVMQYGSLVSATEEQVLADGALNLLLVGANGRWEYIQFITATLTAPDTFAVTGLLRGCRGTEQHIGSHAVGDTVIAMDSGFLRRNVGASEIGDTDYYKAVSQGRAASSAFSEAVTFTAAAQRPYSAVHGQLTKDSGTGDWTIDAVRRTRLGGANIDGQDVPLGEVSEAWEADIMDGADVVRTITGTSLPLTYTDAQAIADFGSNPSSLDVNLYQMSPSLALRGFPLALAA